MSLGERFIDDETEVDKIEENNLKSDLEIVTSSGRGKNGALCVLQNSIKPHIITSFALSGKIIFLFTKKKEQRTLKKSNLRMH